MVYAVRRLAILVGCLLGASVLTFALLHVLPGSPAEVMLGTQATPDAVASLNSKLGLDDSLLSQYLDWIHGLITGRLGDSYLSGLSISGLLAQALQVTIPLIILGTAVGLVIAVPLGVVGALRHNHAVGTGVGAVSQLGVAIPTFVSGILLIVVFSAKLHALPPGGFPGWQVDPWHALQSLLLPAISLGLVQGAIISRFLRAALLDVVKSDYYRTARAKGLPPFQALLRHGLRNASIPVSTVFGMELGSLIVGAIVIENVYTLPGVGTMLLQAVTNRDLVVVQDIVMFVAVLVLAINMLLDFSYRLLDPRLGGTR